MELDWVIVHIQGPDSKCVGQLRLEGNVWSALAHTANLILVLIGNGRDLNLVFVLGRVRLLVLHDVNVASSAAISAVIRWSVGVETCRLY